MFLQQLQVTSASATSQMSVHCDSRAEASASIMVAIFQALSKPCMMSDVETHTLNAVKLVPHLVTQSLPSANPVASRPILWREPCRPAAGLLSPAQQCRCSPTPYLLQRPSAGSLRALSVSLAFVQAVQIYDHQSREAKAHQGVLCCFPTRSLCHLASTQHTTPIAWIIHMVRYSLQVFSPLLIMTEICGSLDSMVRRARQLLLNPAQESYPTLPEDSEAQSMKLSSDTRCSFDSTGPHCTEPHSADCIEACWAGQPAIQRQASSPSTKQEKCVAVNSPVSAAPLLQKVDDHCITKYRCQEHPLIANGSAK